MRGTTTIIVNASSGEEKDAELLRTLRDAAEHHGLEVSIEQAHSGEEITKLAREALDGGCGTIVAGGGDGTVNAIASLVAGTDVLFGVLPLGTLNHFAKDLGMPLDLAESVAVLAEGHTRRVDLGEVNGTIFVNNSSLGLYPHIVRSREEQQERLGRNKWMALTWATLSMLGRRPPLDVHVSADGREIVTRTHLVFIGNNEYSIDGLTIGTRERLDAGELCLYLPREVGKGTLFWFALRALLGRLREADRFEATCVRELKIATAEPRIKVAIDGEVVTMETPLLYRSRPGALTVIAPRERGA
jgi:diacylglycerol kinase family enzyme